VILGLLAPCSGMLGAHVPARGDEPLRPRAKSASFRRPHLADYDAEPRLLNGRVDIDRLVVRLRELKATTYYWLIYHAPTDWDDLKLFLPKAAAAKLAVRVYLVPPSECPPYSEPFRDDYERWAEEIARLSLRYSNLTGWVIDDFYGNRAAFTPAHLRQIQTRAKQINPDLAFLPLMYFNEIDRRFVDQYRTAIDGVVVAYPQDRQEIDNAWAILNDVTTISPGQFECPEDTRSAAGDFAAASVLAKVGAADRAVVRFHELSDYSGPTAGYHFRQLLADDQVVWERDVSGGKPGWHEVVVDLSQYIRGKTQIRLTFRLFDKKGVGNFGVRWRLNDLETTGLNVSADFREPWRWQASRRGTLSCGFGKLLQPGKLQFHIPYVVMTAADTEEFRHRHGDPASPQRMAEWLQMCLQAQRDGKCDGVVTYCLDKIARNRLFPLAAGLFHSYRDATRPD
jgi:hypothetical protein